jgi:hypothetical protein
VTDQPGPAAAASHPPPPIVYTERLYTPWWWYLAGLAIAVLLGGEFATAIPTWIAWIPFGLLLVVMLLGVWRFSSGRVTITATEFKVGEKTLPLTSIERAIGLSSTELRRLVGRHSDPTAFNFIRSWVGPGVQLILVPPAPGDIPRVSPEQFEDGALAPSVTPYWVVSTRHPEQVLAALSAASVFIV